MRRFLGRIALIVLLNFSVWLARHGVLEEDTVATLVGVLLPSLWVALLLRRAPRRWGLATSALGAALAVGVALHLHGEMRGERPDTGADPTVPRTELLVSEAESVWSLGSSGGTMRFRATGPRPRVRLVELAQHVPVRIENTRTCAPSDAAPDTLRIVVWSDARGGGTAFRRLIDAIRAERPDFSVGLGDFVGMARTYQFEILDRRLSSTGVPAFLVPGNHDLDPFGTLRPYARVFGPSRWAFVERGVLCVGLDAARGWFEPGEAKFLESTLAAHRAAAHHVLLFVPCPLWQPPGRPWKEIRDDDESRRVRMLAEREAMHVFSGNFHGFDEQRHGRVAQTITGGAGSRLEDGDHHFVRVRVSPDGVTTERVELMRADEVQPMVDRLLVLQEEASIAARDRPMLVMFALLGAALAIGGLASALRPARRRAVSDRGA